MRTLQDDNHCFVCGAANPVGLKLAFGPSQTPWQVEAEVLFADHFQGWEGIVHGGLVSTVLDEAMVKAAIEAGLRCVTARMNVSFKKPLQTGRRYRVRGRVVEEKRRLVLTEGELLDHSDQPVARAEATFFRITRDET